MVGGDAADRARGETPELSAPIRLAVLFFPNGVRDDMWTPQTEGRDFQLSPTLEPLAELKDELLVLTHLWNQASNVGDGHYVKDAGFLTCTTINKTLGIDLNCNGVSMDQMAARHVAQQTPLPSLELGIEPVSIGVDRNVGYTRVYGSHVAWSSPTCPLAREINPQLVFERLFRVSQAEAAGTERDLRLLDRVMQDATQLQQRLGAADRRRMDEYLQSVRSLEQRLQRVNQSGQPAWTPRAELDPALKPTTGIPGDHAEHVRLMLDMIALAFQTDTTRVCTLMLGNSVSNINFSFVEGVTGSHHELSHHQQDPDKLRQYQLINRWYVAQYAYLLQKLRRCTRLTARCWIAAWCSSGQGCAMATATTRTTCLCCWQAVPEGDWPPGSTWSLPPTRRWPTSICPCSMHSAYPPSGSRTVPASSPAYWRSLSTMCESVFLFTCCQMVRKRCSRLRSHASTLTGDLPSPAQAL